jgi:hypothetical protein
VISKIGGKFPKIYNLVEFSLQKFFPKISHFWGGERGKKKLWGKKKHWFHSTIIFVKGLTERKKSVKP